jgi:hypothetical protein
MIAEKKTKRPHFQLTAQRKDGTKFSVHCRSGAAARRAVKWGVGRCNVVNVNRLERN